MASKYRTAGAQKPAPASETSESIAEQTRLFLKGGGKIQKIPSGVSGQPLGYRPRSAVKK